MMTINGAVDHPDFRRGLAGLWDRLVWVADPQDECVWSELTVRFAVIVWVFCAILIVPVNIVVRIVGGPGTAEVSYPSWFPWIFFAVGLVALVGGGRRAWRGSSIARHVVYALLVLFFAFVAVHGYRVAWAILAELLLIILLGLVEHFRDKATTS